MENTAETLLYEESNLYDSGMVLKVKVDSILLTNLS